MTYQVDDRGYYGEFGGAFIPEMLHANVENLKKSCGLQRHIFAECR